MQVTIAKVGEVLYQGKAHSLTVPGVEGEMTVLGHHEPLVTTLKRGDARVRESATAEPKIIPIEGGILEVTAEGATVIL